MDKSVLQQTEKEERWARLAAELAGASGTEGIRLGEPMLKHTTFQAGGPAAVFAEPENFRELAAMLAFCRSRDIPCTVVGRGSNLLVSDEGYDGVVVHLGEKLSRIRVDGTRIEAEAGCQLAVLARTAKQQGLSGLEFAAGIPGSLGGALAMNAGAYGGEMKDVVTEVLILPEEGEPRWIPSAELAFGYRTSRIQKEGLTALAARMELLPGNPEEIGARINELAEKRRSKQPLEYPSAGSTFKRPEGYFAGKLIQDAGLAGYSVGGACVSEKHCGFVINRDHASASDILAVCRHAQEVVFRQTGVHLELEIRLLGNFPGQQSACPVSETE